MALLPQYSGARANQQSVPASTRLTIVYRPIDTLKLNAENPRLHTDRQLLQIARSIQAFGFLVPVLIDRHACVIAGHGRVKAALRLGVRELPTVSVEHLAEPQITAFRIADNKLTTNSQWDEMLLAGQLKFLSEAELDFNVEATGFEVGEIDVLVEGLSPANEEDPDAADAVPAPLPGIPVSKIGDCWVLGRHRVYCGNALNEDTFLALMQGRRAAMVFTDPPYNLAVDHVTGLGAIQHENFQMAAGEMSRDQFSDFLAQICALLAKHSVDGSIHFLFMDWRHIGEILQAGSQAYHELKNVCVWVKDNGGMGSMYRSQHEFVFVFKNGKDAHRNNVQLGQFGRYRTNVWTYSGVNSFSRNTDEGNLLELHPTVKPVALVADAIMDCSARGDIVLDPFLGSGTTVIAAERTGRICYGLEIEPVYVDTTVRRWQTFTGKTATHEASRRSFTELEQEAASGLTK